jgi:ubiquinone/menaquinone biosynthesis C-methylase UbiE
MTPSQYYQAYISDDAISPLSVQLLSQIVNENPLHVLDFGSGTGKHCNFLNKKGIVTLAIDISMMNVIKSHTKYDLPFVACTNESYLGHLCGIDVVTTCSVLDHIEDITRIIDQFKRICNKSIIIAETQDVVGELYYAHDYESYGFKYTGHNWLSNPPNGDGCRYKIWKWVKGENETIKNGDDLAKCAGTRV